MPPIYSHSPSVSAAVGVGVGVAVAVWLGYRLKPKTGHVAHNQARAILMDKLLRQEAEAASVAAAAAWRRLIGIRIHTETKNRCQVRSAALSHSVGAA